MPGYQLDSAPQMQSGDFPSWLPTQAPTAALRRARSQLPDLFNFDPIQQTGNQYIQGAFNQQANTAASAARAAQNRAMLSGGRVGASFAQASSMLPLYQQQNEQAFKLAGLQGQMQAQRAGLLAQLAQGISGAQAGNRSLLANYGLGQQRLQQDQNQFNSSQDLQRQYLNLARLRQQQDQQYRYDAMNRGQPFSSTTINYDSTPFNPSMWAL